MRRRLPVVDFLKDGDFLYHGSFCEVLEDCSNYDVIGGKIANDATNSTIVTYMANAFGEVGSASADDICIRLLLPERLKNQYCFKSVAALNQLSFMGSERVWM